MMLLIQPPSVPRVSQGADRDPVSSDRRYSKTEVFWRSPERVCGLMERADAIRPTFEPPLAQVRFNERCRQMPPSHGKYHSCSRSDGRDQWEKMVLVWNLSLRWSAGSNGSALVV
ncbi:hypothetical protein DPX16_4855 [Anabarilius grahami]|uniref:Uncharacterized protein n=1 Tax=Anabarilius grahami TaxID=495550 RepID=A0A3N0Y1B1_ANAGA|nr:hypothetical protein DPX16_4855 [Anabarilius grahami]